MNNQLTQSNDVQSESTATLTSGFDRRRSDKRDHKIGYISAIFEPHSTKASASLNRYSIPLVHQYQKYV